MARDIVWLSGERISGRKAAGCRRSFDDGHSEVTDIVLRKTDESPLSWIQISADLITTPIRYTVDMRVFRQVLPGIWVHPDGPHYRAGRRLTSAAACPGEFEQQRPLGVDSIGGNPVG